MQLVGKTQFRHTEPLKHKAKSQLINRKLSGGGGHTVSKNLNELALEALDIYMYTAPVSICTICMYVYLYIYLSIYLTRS